MANQEHVDRLLQGVEAWNRWRRENRKICPDLRNADLRNADLRNANLSSANLSSADLSNAYLRRANLIGAKLSSAKLSNADLSDAKLRSADLSDAKLSRAKLSDAKLDGANLSGADLSRANLNYAKLDGANLNNASLSGASLSGASLSGAKLRNADLRSTNLIGAKLNNADLIRASLNGANLIGAKLNNADLSNANLIGADLSNADLSSTKLSGAKLIIVQALQASFQAATLTGACITDWHINSNTNLQEVICEYIFTQFESILIEYDDKRLGERCHFTDRRPHDPNQIFAPGEFTKRYQIVLETVDLFFHDGIDWTAFLDSLHDLQSQYGNELSIRDIGRRAGGSFVVQLEVPPESDKGTIERQAKELYATKLQQLEAHYQERLQLRGEQLLFFQEQVGIERIRNTRLERIIETMAEKDSPKYDLRGAKFGGGFAADGGTQTGGTFNDFSQNIEQNINEIGGLIQSLRSQAEAFPEGIRQETLEHLGDLESDIQQPPEQRKPSRIKATLLALAGMATLVSGAVAGANEFVGQVQELSDKLGIPLPIEQLQPQPPDAIDVQAIGSDRS